MAPRLGLGNSVTANPVIDSFDNTYSVDFDGSNDYMDAGTGIGDTLGDNYTGSLSVSFWFKADNTARTYDGMFDIGPFNGNGGKFWVQMHSNKLRFWLDEFNWMRTVAFTDSSSWHHLVAIYAAGSATNSKMYLDGSSVGTISSSYNTFPSSSDMDFAGLKTILAGYYSTSYTWAGLIDELAIFNSELSASQVTSIYNSGKPKSLTSLSPLGWWRLGGNDGGTGTTITDQGSGGNDGTLVNGPAFSTSVP